MPKFKQAERPLRVTTPLGEDVLLAFGCAGHEGVSQLFHFKLELYAENEQTVALDKLIGEKVTLTIALPENKERYLNGICIRASQGGRDWELTSYGVEIVPELWRLTRIVRSRIFQQLSVPEILKLVFVGLTMTITYEIQGTYEPRDYCVQYRESDFDFASRLMEEEGIYYFFKHSRDNHEMVVSDAPTSHPDLPEFSQVKFNAERKIILEEDYIYAWEKSQELTAGKFTLWDHSFELPDKHLDSEVTIPDTVSVGSVSHKIKVAQNDQLEIYDYPGEYAHRFAGVDPGGGDTSSNLEKIFQDNKRTVEIRMEEDAASALRIWAHSNCRQLVSGHKFTLSQHFNADGEYLLVEVDHKIKFGGRYRSGEPGEFEYENTFVSIPTAVPFRPRRVTPRPIVRGTQTAVVVGPAGEEIFTDKYGRVKVQFHWHREGVKDSKSSCWVRVGTVWAGKQWGAIHIPRIGQEVIVDFLEGNPDCPIIVGSVYNAEQMPVFTLPGNKVKSGITSLSTMQGGGFNEISFDDTKGKERITIHGQFDMHSVVENDYVEQVVNDLHLTVGGSQFEQIEKDRHVYVKGEDNYKTDGTLSINARQSLEMKVGQNQALDAAQEIHLKAGMNLVLESGMKITLKGSGGFITIDPGGITIQGTLVNINSGGAAGSGAGSSPSGPTAPKGPEKGQAGSVSAPQGAGGGGSAAPPPPPPPKPLPPPPPPPPPAKEEEVGGQEQGLNDAADDGSGFVAR